MSDLFNRPITIRAKRGTEAQIIATSPVPYQLEGEFAYATDNEQFYISNGTKFNPFASMDIGTAQGQMAFYDATLGKWTYTENTELFWDDTNKRLGIGTDSPGSRLDLGMSPGTPGNLQLSTYAYSGVLYSSGAVFLGYNAKADTGTSGMKVANTNGVVGFDYMVMDYNGGIRFHTLLGSVTAGNSAGNERMRINTDGNVGIGTASPGYILDVQSPSLNTLARFYSGDNGALIRFEDTTNSWQCGQDTGHDFVIIDMTEGTVPFQILNKAPTNSLYINGLGNVGIGTASPSQKLDVAGKIALNDGGNSVFLGEGAGLNDEGTDNKNVGIGMYSLYYNITGSQNTANGYQSLYANTTGSYNTANGMHSLYLNTTGSDNTANGYRSLRNNTIGSYNIANGMRSLYYNITGNNNTANGYGSLFSSGKTLTAGSFITGVSYTIISTGDTDFTAIGSANNTEGTVFTATGAGTGTGTASANANNNLGFGYQAGKLFTGSNELTAPSKSIFLGSDTMALEDGGTNEIVIGNDAVGLGSNTVVLGNDSVVTTALKGNVGIGTDSPTARLHLPAGTATANTAPQKFTAGTLLTTKELGAVEFIDDGTDGKLYITLNIGGTLTRKEIAFV